MEEDEKVAGVMSPQKEEQAAQGGLSVVCGPLCQTEGTDPHVRGVEGAGPRPGAVAVCPLAGSSGEENVAPEPHACKLPPDGPSPAPAMGPGEQGGPGGEEGRERSSQELIQP